MKLFFKFHKGTKPLSIKTYIITILTTAFIIGIVSNCSKIPEIRLWELVDEIQRRYFPNRELNEHIINDPELLKRRIQRDVDRAIERVTPEYDRIIKEADQKYEPRFIEKPVDESVCYTEECKSLGGEMRICAPWVQNCN